MSSDGSHHLANGRHHPSTRLLNMPLININMMHLLVVFIVSQYYLIQPVISVIEERGKSFTHSIHLHTIRYSLCTTNRFPLWFVCFVTSLLAQSTNAYLVLCLSCEWTASFCVRKNCPKKLVSVLVNGTISHTRTFIDRYKYNINTPCITRWYSLIVCLTQQHTSWDNDLSLYQHQKDDNDHQIDMHSFRFIPIEPNLKRIWICHFDLFYSIWCIKQVLLYYICPFPLNID